MDIKCSKCSKLNEEGAKVCIFCGAQLTETMDDVQKPTDGDPVDDLLASLRDAGSVDSEAAIPGTEDEPLQEPFDSEEDVPDWLMRIRKITEEDDTQKDEWIPSETEDVPDWLSSLAAESGADDKPDFTSPGEDPAEGTDELAETAFIAAEEDLAGEADSGLEWLQNIETEADVSEETSFALPTDPEEVGQEEQEDLQADLSETLMEGLPNWLQEEEQPEPAADAVEETTDADPSQEDDDLLARLQSFDPGSEDAPQEEVAAEDLLSETVVEESESSTSGTMDLEKELEALDFVENEDLTQWIESVQAEIDRGEEPASVETAPPAEEEELAEPDEYPASLKDISLEAESEQEAFTTAEEPHLPEELIKESEESQSAAEPEEAAQLFVEPTEEQTQAESEPKTPDWMSLREEGISSDAVPDEDGLPDWKAEPKIAGNADAGAQDRGSSVDDDDLPGWLFGEEEPSAEEDEGMAAWKAFDREGAEADSPEEEDLSEWLGDLTPESSQEIFDTKREKIAGDSQSETPPFVGQDIGAWMKEEGEEPSKEEVSGDEAPLSDGEELPDWLGSEAGELEKEAPRQEPAKEKEEIKQADLPDWLESMRPIESVLPEQITSVDDKKVEQSGPLAGLRAVLPSTPSATHYRKPPIYSVKLQVSEKQRAHAAMLENLLDEERRTAAKKEKSAGAPLRVIRTVIAIILIAAVLLPILGIPEVSMIPPTTSVAPFYDQLEAVPAGSPVLLAVDYTPGYAGEMGYAGTGVVQRMMERELRIAAVSTLPTGPVLTEGMKASVFERDGTLQERYENRDWFINLGYLPGEVVSLQEFAQYPRQAVRFGLSTGLENRPVWDSGVLLQVNDLSDFAMVVLFTDTIENGRAWIEQVQPALDGVPLLVVSSAQASPMLKPYLHSGQVQAMLSGMGDGLAYEEILKLPDEERGSFWLANQFGLLAIIFIILVGALIEGISSLVGRSRSDEA